MKFSKLLLAAVFAFVMTAGALMAADEPLEIHGGGRIGWAVNNKLGSDNGSIVDNRMGRYPNHGETNYYSLWFSKKTTAESGAWAKVTFGMDNWNSSPSGDLAPMKWRLRGFNVEFGALDFLPQGSTLKAGLFGIGQGWDDAQDFGVGPNFSGIGTGITGLGGLVGIYYMAQDADNPAEDGAQNGYNAWDAQSSETSLGERTMHAFVVTVNHAMVDVVGGFGYAKKADNPGEKNLTAFAVGAVVKLPVAGLNVFAQAGSNNWAIQMQDGNADDTVLKGCSFEGVAQDKAYEATLVKVGFFSVYDLGEGMYVAPAAFYQYFKGGKDAIEHPDNTTNLINGTVKFSKSLTQNIAFAPAFGYHRSWMKEDEGTTSKDPQQDIQVTAGLEMGLNTGYWAGQKVQVYATYCKSNEAVYETGKKSKVSFGTYVTFGF